MDKLGYTFYPKDFISDPDVMMMTPSQRGVYRDLIDLAYMNDNKIKYNLIQLSKYCNATEEEINEVLSLKGQKIDNFWTIPSCNKRIAKSKVNRANGSKGGRPKKTKENPIETQNETQNETQTKPNLKGKEKEKEKEKENIKENKEETNPLTPKGESFDFLNSLIDLGVEEQVAKDWMKVRRTKKATNTQTAFKILVSQIEKSGKKANDCIELCVFNSWSGFKSEYIKSQPQDNNDKYAHLKITL